MSCLLQIIFYLDDKCEFSLQWSFNYKIIGGAYEYRAIIVGASLSSTYYGPHMSGHIRDLKHTKDLINTT